MPDHTTPPRRPAPVRLAYCPGAPLPLILYPDAATDAEMQSRVYQELHQRRQAAARVTGGEPERTAFITGLLEDDLLVQDARRSFLAHLRRSGVTERLFAAAADVATEVVLRAAFRRTGDLLQWNPDVAPLAGWWGQQALFEYNNDGRRFAERSAGYRRGARTNVTLVSADALPVGEDEPAALDVPDVDADPALRFERYSAGDLLEALFIHCAGDPALVDLRVWLAADALHEDAPVSFSVDGARVAWRRSGQQDAAALQGVTPRTIRNRARAVETLLERLRGLAGAA